MKKSTVLGKKNASQRSTTVSARQSIPVNHEHINKMLSHVQTVVSNGLPKEGLTIEIPLLRSKSGNPSITNDQIYKAIKDRHRNMCVRLCPGSSTSSSYIQIKRG